MDDQEIDILIAATAQNVRYFTGFAPVVKMLNPNRGECYAILKRDRLSEVSVVHSVGESDQLLDMTAPLNVPWLFGTFHRRRPGGVALCLEEEQLIDFGPPVALTAAHALTLALRDAIGRKPSPRVLIDQEGLPIATRARLAEECTEATLIEGSQTLRHVRAVKTEAEVETLTRAARQNEAAVAKCLKTACLGMPESDLAHLFETALVAGGGRVQATMIKIGRHAATGQRRPNHKHLLASGDVIWFDSDTSSCEYWSDIARTAVLGRPSALQVERYEALHAGMSAGVDAMGPGRTGAEIFDIVMSTVRDAGLPDYARHHVGHGIGLEAYEGLILAASDSTVMEPGMVISLETPFYEFGFGALHIEDPVLITETGARYLTKDPNPELVVIPLEDS